MSGLQLNKFGWIRRECVFENKYEAYYKFGIFIHYSNLPSLGQGLLIPVSPPEWRDEELQHQVLLQKVRVCYIYISVQWVDTWVEYWYEMIDLCKHNNSSIMARSNRNCTRLSHYEKLCLQSLMAVIKMILNVLLSPTDSLIQHLCSVVTFSGNHAA
jgi:hypothetical protein